jgi:hypothetical protein
VCQHSDVQPAPAAVVISGEMELIELNRNSNYKNEKETDQ